MKSKVLYLLLVICILVLPVSTVADVKSLDDVDEFEIIMTDTFDETEVSFLGYQKNDKYFLPLEDILTQLNYYVEYDDESNTIYATSLNPNSPEHIYEINLDDQTLIYHAKKGVRWIEYQPKNLYLIDDFDNQVDGLVLIDNEVYIDRNLVRNLFKDIKYMNDNWQAFNRQEAEFRINMQYRSEK